MRAKQEKNKIKQCLVRKKKDWVWVCEFDEYEVKMIDSYKHLGVNMKIKNFSTSLCVWLGGSFECYTGDKSQEKRNKLFPQSLLLLFRLEVFMLKVWSECFVLGSLQQTERGEQYSPETHSTLTLCVWNLSKNCIIFQNVGKP